MINWKPETEKPPAYKSVLIALIGGDITTGHWSAKTNGWIGYAYNQSPPIYRLDDGAVKNWAEINAPDGER